MTGLICGDYRLADHASIKVRSSLSGCQGLSVSQNHHQGSKCPPLPGFTHWVNPGKPGLGFKPYFGKSGEYWVIKYFK